MNIIEIKSNKWFVGIGSVGILILAMLITQMYVKRGVQGRLRDASGYLGIEGRLRSSADDIGDQFSPGNTSIVKGTGQYEAYYLQSSYAVQPSGTPGGGPMAIPAARKLIQKAELSLEVKSSRDTATKIAGLAAAAGGYMLDSQIQKYGEDAQSGHVVLKVPPGSFGTLLEQIKVLGKVDLERATGEDVTEEYVDLQARLNNSRLVRERLIKILEVNSNNVRDILEVEREIARVGEQMERIEGRIKFLEQEVALATITVNFYEVRPLAPGAFNIVNRFKETLRDAANVFITVFNGILVLLSSLLPVGLWLGIGFGIYRVIRKSRRRD